MPFQIGDNIMSGIILSMIHCIGENANNNFINPLDNI